MTTSLADQFSADAAAAPAPVAKKVSLSSQFASDSVPTPSTQSTQPAAPPAAPRKWWEISPEQQASNEKAIASGDYSAGSAIAQTGAHAVSSAFGSLVGLTRGAGAWAAGASLEDIAHEVEDTRNSLTYDPPAGSSGAALLNTVGGMKYSPLKLLGDATGAFGDKTLQATGSPLLATIADTGTNAAVTLGAGKALARATRPTGAQAPVTKPAPAPVARIEPTMEPVPAPAIANAPGTPVTAPVPQPVGTPVAQARGPAANEPVKPTISDPQKGLFAESNPDVKGGLPEDAQNQRIAVLQAIGLDRVRTSAITGDSAAAANDFQISRLHESPAGAAMKQTLDGEKAALQSYADSIAKDTGGSALNDQSAKLARGESILTPLEGLKDWFDNQTSTLYKTADERAQGVPTQLDTFRSVLGDDSLATNSDRVNLRSAASAYAKKLGIIDEQGNVFANAQQAETMRKYLNENWSPQNSGLVSKLKDALDQDVMASAGEDVYGQARALRAQRAATLDNPNGIAKLLDSSGPQGVNRAVPVERVADTLTTMPVAQLQNIVNTLKNMPPELQPMAQDAIAEIKAQYAHNVQDIGSKHAGQWNAKGVRQYLANNSARMQAVFEPEEMQKFGTLNDAGNILAKDQSYPGAAAQERNLVRTGVTHAITSGMTALGGALGGAPGAVAGGLAGAKMAGKVNDAASLRAAQKRMTNISDLLPPSD